ncbi:MAG: hypothetical protein ACI9JN_002301, partial [Bacteroidia bacterium]
MRVVGFGSLNVAEGLVSQNEGHIIFKAFLVSFFLPKTKVKQDYRAVKTLSKDKLFINSLGNFTVKWSCPQ